MERFADGRAHRTGICHSRSARDPETVVVRIGHALSGRTQDDGTLAQPLSPEDCQIQSMPDASPVKWHLAHTTWFFETFVLVPHARGYRGISSVFRYLFNSYYNSVGDRLARPQRGLITRPTLEEIYSYRAAVDRQMEAYLESAGEALSAEIAAVIELGLNHEQQHQELILTDIKHALGTESATARLPRRGGETVGNAEVPPMGWSFVMPAD